MLFARCGWKFIYWQNGKVICETLQRVLSAFGSCAHPQMERSINLDRRLLAMGPILLENKRNTTKIYRAGGKKIRFGLHYFFFIINDWGGKKA